MKVALHVFGSLQPSGMEKMIYSSAREWEKSNWQIVVLGIGLDHPFRVELEELGIRVESIPEIRSLKGMYQFGRALKRINPDLVHIHVEGLHGPLGLVSRLSLPKARLVRTIHSIFRFSGRIRLTRTLQSLLFLSVGGDLVAPSKDVSDHEQKYWHFKTRVIENWVGESFRVGSGVHVGMHENFSCFVNVIMVGNCASVKRHEIVMSAALGNPRLLITHIGNTAHATLREKNAMQALEDNKQIRSLGSISNVAEVLERGDIYAMPSEVEGLSVALLEALCVGLPALVANVQGFQWARDLPGVILLNEHDWEKELSLIARDPRRLMSLKVLSDGNKENIRNRFSSERGVTEYISLYEEDLTWWSRLSSSLF